MRLLLVLALAFGGCTCGSAPAANPDFWGPTIEPPGGLGRIKPGMSVKEAKQQVPGLREDSRSVRDSLVLDSGVSDIKLEVRVESGTVSSILAIVQGQGAKDMMTKAW